MILVLTCIAIGAAILVMRPNVEAVALVKFPHTWTVGEYENYIQQLDGPPVLNAVLENPALRRLAGSRRDVIRLVEAIEVDRPGNGEIVRIRLGGNSRRVDPKLLLQLVDRTVDAWLNQINTQDSRVQIVQKATLLHN